MNHTSYFANVNRKVFLLGSLYLRGFFMEFMKNKLPNYVVDTFFIMTIKLLPISSLITPFDLYIWDDETIMFFGV